GDAALAVGREWIAASTTRIGAQDLDRVRSTWRGVGVHRRQDACLAMRAAQQVVYEPEWIAAERPMVIPPFAKAIFKVAHGRAVDRQLRVVPGWSGTVDRRHRLMLPVTFMAGIVAPAVTEVYAADESHVPFSSFSVADDDEFLVMRAAESHALVEQDLAPG
ncbi:MAG TPA: hypothetical protein VIJ91_03065, partial [Candidatus Dormibacteraeota bacterium]